MCAHGQDSDCSGLWHRTYPLSAAPTCTRDRLPQDCSVESTYDVCVCSCTHSCAHLCGCTLRKLHVCLHTCTCACVQLYTRLPPTCTCAHLHMHSFALVYVYMYTLCASIYLRVAVHTCACVYMCTNTVQSHVGAFTKRNTATSP